MSYFNYFSPDGEYKEPTDEDFEWKECFVDEVKYPEHDLVFDKTECNWIHPKNIDVYLTLLPDATQEEKEEIRMDLLNQLKNK